MPLFVINFTVAHLSLGGSSLLKGMVNSPHLAGELNHFATFFLYLSCEQAATISLTVTLYKVSQPSKALLKIIQLVYPTFHLCRMVQNVKNGSTLLHLPYTKNMGTITINRPHHEQAYHCRLSCVGQWFVYIQAAVSSFPK